jgi:hypothetical protein
MTAGPKASYDSGSKEGHDAKVIEKGMGISRKVGD